MARQRRTPLERQRRPTLRRQAEPRRRHRHRRTRRSRRRRTRRPRHRQIHGNRHRRTRRNQDRHQLMRQPRRLRRHRWRLLRAVGNWLLIQRANPRPRKGVGSRLFSYQLSAISHQPRAAPKGARLVRDPLKSPRPRTRHSGPRGRGKAGPLRRCLAIGIVMAFEATIM
jgi:hypothetical protein